MANYFVFRVDYGECFPFIYEELKQGRLRQGWGGPNMDVRNSFDEFTAAWEKWSTPWEDMEERYGILRRMLQIQEGDLIIIPKVSMQYNVPGRYFTIVRCTKPYEFSIPDAPVDYFGHYVEVEPVVSCEYDSCGATQRISSSFIGYQCAVNRVIREGVMDAIDILIAKQGTENKAFNTRLDMLLEETDNARNLYLKELVHQMQSWQNSTFEDVIENLFVKNGYIKVRSNYYDGDGGDVDLVFKAFSERTLMHDIYAVYDDEIMPEIYIQAKKKCGHDSNDITGIEQLVQMAKKNNRAKSLILINLTDEFSKEAEALAERERVVLLNGQDFASLIVRHGLDVGVSATDSVDEV